MSDDARRALTEDERARIQAARREGGLCAGCGRSLAPGEPTWVVRFDVHGDGWSYWHAPVGRECVPPDALRANEGVAPEACAGCGRPVYYGAATKRSRVAVCSKRCDSRRRMRRKEGS